MAKLPAIELAAPLTLLFLLAALPARADIKVQPSVDLRETYSDNASLASDSSNNGQFITELTPTLSLLSNGPRLKLTARAIGHLYAFSGARPNGTSQSNLELTANGKARLIDELLFLDGSVNRTRQSVSAFGPQFQQGYSNNNIDNITTYTISPYLQHRFGTFAEGQLRYTRNGVDGQQVSQYSSTGDFISAFLNSGPKFVRVAWQLQAFHQNLNDLIAGKSTVDTISATLRYRLRDEFSLYTIAGYDKYAYQGLGGTTKGKNYSAGFTWTPSPRTSLDASAGRRFFGNTYSLAASHRSRNTVFSASYRDEVTTTRDQFLLNRSVDTATLLDASFASAFPDPIARRQAIEAYLRATGLPLTVANNINFLSNRLYLQKQAQAAVVVNGSRSSMIVSADNTKRQALSNEATDIGLPSDAIAALSNNTSQRTFTAAFNYRMSGRSSATVTASRARVTSLDTGLTQNQTYINFILSRQFDRKLSGTLELRHNQGTTYNQSAGYRENAISASLSYHL